MVCSIGAGYIREPCDVLSVLCDTGVRNGSVPVLCDRVKNGAVISCSVQRCVSGS